MSKLITGLIKSALVLAVVITLISCGGAEERKIKYLEKGKTYMEEKNYDKARIEFKNVLQIDPKFANAYYYMGQLDEINKDFGKALSNYRKATELNPDYVDAKISLAKIYVVIGTSEFIDKASSLLTEVEAIEPNNDMVVLIRGTILYKQGRRKDAIDKIEKLVNKNILMSEAVSLLSTMYAADNRLDDSISLLKTFVSNDKDNITLRISLAKQLAQKNQLPEAEKYLLDVINIEPEMFSLKVALASFYASSNQLDKAESILRSAIDQDDEDVQRYMVMAEMLSARFGFEKANTFFTQSIKNKPGLNELKFAQVKLLNGYGKKIEARETLKRIISEDAYSNDAVKAKIILSNSLVEGGEIDAALIYLDDVLNEHPNNNDALLVKGKVSLARNNTVDAINSLRAVIKSDPKNSGASLLLAQAHELASESSLAESELRRSLEVNPDDVSTHINYAKYLASKGRIDESEKVVDRAMVYFKDNYALTEVKLKLLLSKNKVYESLSLLKSMELSSPTVADVNVYRGKIYLANKDVDNAIFEFEKAFNKTKDKYGVLELITKSYLSSKSTTKALSRVKEQIKLQPDYAPWYYLLGDIYQATGRVSDALDNYVKASEINESWIKPYLRVASIYASKSNFSEAVNILKTAEQKSDNPVSASMQIAAIYEKTGEIQKSISIYEAILKDNMSNMLAANNLASLLLDYGKPDVYTRALELAKSFENIKQPALQDTLAWAYAKSGDNLMAIEILSPIVDKASNVPVFRYHLGYALFNSGDKAAAKSHLEVAVSSEQDFAGKDNARALLESI